jgi:hypothetical protein
MTKSILPFTDIDDKIIEKTTRRRESIAENYPLTFALVGTFGLISTFYGFEKLIDKVSLFADQPWILLIIGLATLSATGLALRKLG